MEEIESSIWIEREKDGSVAYQNGREMVRRRGSKGVFLLNACSREDNALLLIF